MPKEGKNVIRYKPGSRSLKINSVIYSDFECILMPYSGCDKENATTKKLDKHVPCGYSINVVSNHSKETKQTVYRGDGAISTFCKELRNIAQVILNTDTKSMQPLSKKEQKAYDNAKYCHICKKVWGKHKNHKKVRDHDHYTGKIRGAAHSILRYSNLRYSTQIDVPVIFHNRSNYDFNLLIEEFAKEYESDINCIPLNTNKYMSFSVPIKKEVTEPKDDDKKGKKKVLTYSLRFIDSAKHVDRGLSTLADNLSELTVCKRGPNDSKDIITKGKELKGKYYVLIKCNTFFPSTFKLCKGNLKKFLLSLRKGVYSYEYMDSIDKFNETELPSIDKLYSKLQKKHISDKDYAHAKKVWNIFDMKTLGDYHDLYVQVNTAQLSDVFESFRSTFLKVYNLDPAYFVSTPSLAFQAMLKVTKAEIETFTDIDMILMTEKGTRGGLTQIVKKHAVANNKYLHDYDNTKKCF